MDKILLVTTHLSSSFKGGRESLSELHFSVLKGLLQEDLVIYDLKKNKKTVISQLKSMFGYLDGLTDHTVWSVITLIQQQHITKLFIDGSNLGLLAREVKKNCPEVEVITFFHNVEARFFLGALKKFRTIKSFMIMGANYIAERWAVNHSDIRIMLNQRDSETLKRIYGKSATHISPMAVPDVRAPSMTGDHEKIQYRYALFVGGAFYANRAGIEWYASKVAPKVCIKTLVVGRGFDSLKPELERNGNIEVIGEVDCLSPWYENADFVVAPIFDGSGMKTKVAEALMFGKKIIGTVEAFCGYEDSLPAAGVVCNGVEDFINQMNQYANLSLKKTDSELVKLYEQKYSPKAAKIRFSQILKSE